MPFPYTGCGTCKQRHLKCDGTLPICNRCLKSRRPCHGAKSTTEAFLFIHSENAYASGKRKRPRGPRASPPALSLLPCEDLTTVAISHYIKTSLRTDFEIPSLLKSVDHDILSIYTSRPNDPAIYLALSVLALALFGRTQSQPQALTQACMLYQQLLQKTYSKLSSSRSPSHKEIETSLFVTFCMSRYEDAVHTPSSIFKTQSFTSASHHDGSLALIKTLRDGQKECVRLPRIVQHTRRCMIKSALLRDRDLPEWIQRGEDFGEEGLDLEYDRFSLRLVKLRRHLHLLKSGDVTEPDTLLVTEAHDLSSTFEEWSTRFPSNWSLNHTIEVEAGPSSTTVNESIVRAAIWLRYYATHILILSTHVSLTHLIISTTNNTVTESALLQTKTKLNEAVANCKATFEVLSGSTALLNDDATTTNSKLDMTKLVTWSLSMVLLAQEVQGSERLFFANLVREMGRVSGFAILEDVESVHLGRKG